MGSVLSVFFAKATNWRVKLLEIQSSPSGESSGSIALTTLFIEACKSYSASIVVDTLNVWRERLPEFDYETIGAKYKAEARNDD